MTFLVVFLVTVAAVFALRNPIKKAPVLFYALAVVSVVVFGTGVLGLSGGVAVPLMRRCMVAFALFAVVMFIGVLPEGSKIRAWLRPVRAELSIIACILTIGHLVAYVAPYAQRALAGALQGSALASVAVAFVLLVLLVVLGVTSFDFVKKRMAAPAWKRLQRLAYLFFGLIYVHLLLMLLPSALQGGAQAQLSLGIYTVLFALYAVLRIARAAADRRAGTSAATEDLPEAA